MHRRFFTRAIAAFFVLALFALGSSSALAFPIKMGLAPDNNQKLLLSTIQSAKRRILVNIYQFDSAPITNALIRQIKAGVIVELLVEGEPLGQLSAAGKKTLRNIVDAMKASKSRAHKLWLMTGSGAGNRRFKFNHAKYIVIDGTNVLISSENFTATGHANPLEVGNRGWETVITSPKFAAEIEALFRNDSDPSHGDVIELRKGTPFAGEPASQLPLLTEARVRTIPSIEQADGTASQVTLITSPDALNGMIDVIRSAQRQIEVETMSLPSIWREATPIQNPIITELLLAARRGVNVRVLLNDDGVFSPNTGTGPVRQRPNEITAELLEQRALCERLPLSARIVSTRDLEITYIHNKGILIDGERVLVSSINGTRNSVMNNREVAVLVDSPDAADYFGSAFDFDWENSPSFQTECNPASLQTIPSLWNFLITGPN